MSLDGSLRDTTKYINWVRQEFDPMTLATTDEAITQFVENAIRYWNTHSAYKISSMIDMVSGETRVQVPAAFKHVVQVFPNARRNFIWNESPLWTLTSIQVLDSVSTDLILMSEAFKNYRQYLGADFRWTFQRSDDMDEGGYLYAQNLPGGNTGLMIVGTKRILPTEDVTEQHILDWVLSYVKALVKQCEGNTLRKGALTGLKTDGDQLYGEGRDEMVALQADLQKSARWVVMTKRT